MTVTRLLLSGTFLLLTLAPAQAGPLVKFRFSDVQLGTESVTLVPNGDFQDQGADFGGSHPFPTGWNRTGDMFADPSVVSAPPQTGGSSLGRTSTTARRSASTRRTPSRCWPTPSTSSAPTSGT